MYTHIIVVWLKLKKKELKLNIELVIINFFIKHGMIS